METLPTQVRRIMALGRVWAIEDAYIMVSLLAEIEAAFRAFDTVRRPRTQKLVSTSRECRRVLDCEGKGIGKDIGRSGGRICRRGSRGFGRRSWRRILRRRWRCWRVGRPE